jgi:predicted DNA-binding transcriptional regulator YafY
MSRAGPVSETVQRYWTMLRLVPRAPRKIDTATIERLLEQDGIEVTRRSIQRDLESLSYVFVGLRRDDRSKPYGWCWDSGSPLLDVPGMGVRQAVTFEMLQQHLIGVLPRATIQTLKPYFKRARDVLAQNPNAKMARWPRKVRTLSRGLTRIAPTVARPVLDAVYTALLEERRLLVQYNKRGSDEPKEYEVNPLGLVVHSGTLVLVCSFWDYDNVNQMLLHRMNKAEVLDKTAKRRRGFDLDTFIAEGQLGFRRGDKPLKLVMLVDSRLAVSLHEAPIAADQVLKTNREEGWERLEATVPDTTALRTWLRGHGAMAEVLRPKRLRRELADEIHALAARYES